MQFFEVAQADKTQYMDLLLLADEQLDMIERYLQKGRMYALEVEGVVVSTCVVLSVDDDIFEIKNMATRPSYQRQGYGRRLIEYIIGQYQDCAKCFLVGTGDTPSTLNFYKACGFEYSHVVKDFFLVHYDHPIIEEGHRLVDMIYLKRCLF